MIKNYIFSILILISLLYTACASLQTPTGGPRDITPPKVLNEVPKNLSKNFKGKTIEITFDEYFKLTNEYTEIAISPAPEIAPTFKTKQKTLIINFKDSLEKNTTYSINFGKALQDINESNVLKNYSFVFATGSKLDSLKISGKVISSNDNKMQKEVTVFIIPTSRDSIFGKKKPSLFTITDSSGNFNLKNLREDDYRIYALNEKGGDRIYNSENEEIAFLKDSINLNKDVSGIVLKLFKETPTNLRNLDQKIDNDGKINLVYNKPIPKASITFIDAPTIEKPIIELSTRGDSARIWLREIAFDSLKVVMNSNNIPLDTVTLRRSQKETYKRNITITNNLANGKITPNSPLKLTLNLPIATIDNSKITLLEDSTIRPDIKFKKILPSERIYEVQYPWKVKRPYTIKFQEGAITDIYGTQNKDLALSFELDEVENYGNLSLNIVKEDSLKNYIIQLIDERGKIYSQKSIRTNTTLLYNFIPINKYLVKIVEDTNGNGEFDTGSVKLKIQPEKVYIFDKEIITRANWDREEKIIIPKKFE